VGFGVVKCATDLLAFPAGGGRQAQQWHLVSIQDLVLERVSCPLVAEVTTRTWEAGYVEYFSTPCVV